MAEYKKEIGAAVMVAVLLAASLGTLAIYSFPVALSSTTLETGASTTTTGGTVSFAVTSSASFSTTSGPPASITTSFTPATWEPGQVVSTVLGSSVVQSYIASAYSYDVVSLGPSPGNPNLIAMAVNVTGTQQVTGSPTTGYEVSYTGMRMLNATVQFSAPSSYTLANVRATVLPDVTQSVAYDPEQQQVIQVALSDSTVKGLMGTAAFYVASVTPVPLQNGTYAGDFFALMYQVNGTKLVGVFVNGGMTAAVSSYADTRTETMCFTLGTTEGVPAPEQQKCFTSPWSGAS